MSLPNCQSLIITTYNRPDALRAVLTALDAQTDRGFEAVIADDGSTQETGDMIAELRRCVSYPLIHVWQEDTGFRAGEARNKAVAASRGDYLVFLDGDCIPLPNFVAGHRRMAEPRRFVRGNRIVLSEKFTRRILEEKLPLHAWTFTDMLRHRLTGELPRLLPLLHFPLGRLRYLQPRRWKGAKTCNLGVWREDFTAVNGFDESYYGWGFEDSDLVIRLIRNGVFRKNGHNAMPVFHLWHRLSDRDNYKTNQQRAKECMRAMHTVAPQGLSRHLKAA